MEKLRLRILNMTCAGCVPEIEQVMRQQEGVIWAIVNFAAGEATIMYDPAAFRSQKLMPAVSRLGYQMVTVDKPAGHSHKRSMERKPLIRMQQWIRALSR